MNNITNRLPDTLYAQHLPHIATRHPHMAKLGNEIAAFELRQAALMGVVDNLASANFPMLTEDEWVLILNALNSDDVDNFLYNLDCVTRDAGINVIASCVYDDSGNVPSRIGQLTQLETFSCCLVAQRFWGSAEASKPTSFAEILAEISGRSSSVVFLSEH